jgi:S-(2-succino)cysteine N-acetyltransferase
MSYIIRQATITDVPALLDLTHRAYKPNREIGIQFVAANPTKQLVQKNMEENLCFLLETDGIVRSTASIRMPWGSNPGPYGYPHLWWFATDPTVAKSGYGSILLNHLESEFIGKQLKCPAVTLGTASDHPWLVEMYVRKGYQKFGKKDSGRGHVTQYLIKVLQEDQFPGLDYLKRGDIDEL